MTSEPRSAAHWASADVEGLDLTVRAYNCLERAGISTLGELVKKTPDELLSIRAMGRTTLRVIQDALADRGLHLGMPDIDRGTCQSIDAFLEAVNRVRGHGVTRVADLVTKTPRELTALPGVDAEEVRHIEDGLAKWGLSLGAWSSREGVTERVSVSRPSAVREVAVAPSAQRGVADERAAEWASEERSVQRDEPQTVRDELVYTVARLLADRERSRFLCFAAYHGIDGCRRLTLQEIGDQGPEYGFGSTVSRERVRQIIAKADESLRRRAAGLTLPRWQEAVLDARERVPAVVERVVDAFGYGGCEEPDGVFWMLRLMAGILSLEFTFDVQTIRGTEVVVDGAAACVEVMDVVERLMGVENDSYHDTIGTAAAVGCEVAVLQKAVDGPFGWEFIDEARRYFWRRPCLPPRNHAVTGNAILTGLCKVFSVAREVATVDLAQAISCHRGVRQEVPRQVVEGIAVQSGLFDLEEGVLRRKADEGWFCPGDRELQLLEVCVEHGRVVSSRTLQSSLVRSGLTSRNAAAVIAYSPFLVHTKAGQFHDEGLYKLVCRTEDVVMALEEGGREDTGRTGEADPHTEGARDAVRIPVSPRVRLTGSHFSAEPLDMDGEWRVLGVDGTVIGTVTCSGRLVEGLCSVIDTLDLGMNAVLELRRDEDGDLLAVRT